MEIVENPDNYLDVENVFLPVMCKQQIRRSFEEGDISLVQKQKFLKECFTKHHSSMPLKIFQI